MKSFPATTTSKRRSVTRLISLLILMASLTLGGLWAWSNQSFADTTATAKITDWYITEQGGKRYLVFHYDLKAANDTQKEKAMYSIQSGSAPAKSSTFTPTKEKHLALPLDDLLAKGATNVKLSLKVVELVNGKSDVKAEDTKQSTLTTLTQRGQNLAKSGKAVADPSKSAQPPAGIDDPNKAVNSNEADNYVSAPTEFGPVRTLGEYMEKIMKYALPLGVSLAVLSAVYAGVIFMSSQGQPDRIKDGQEIIQGAILGLVILILVRLLATYLYIPSTGELNQRSVMNPLVTTK